MSKQTAPREMEIRAHQRNYWYGKSWGIEQFIDGAWKEIPL